MVTISLEGQGPIGGLERVELSAGAMVGDLNDMVQAATSIPRARQQLTREGQELESGMSMSQYGQPSDEWENVTVTVKPLPPRVSRCKTTRRMKLISIVSVVLNTVTCANGLYLCTVGRCLGSRGSHGPLREMRRGRVGAEEEE